MKFKKSHIFRRGDRAGGDYYVRIQIRGKRYCQSTHRDSIEQAREVAAHLIRAWKREQFSLAKAFGGRDVKVSTVGEVLTVYRRLTAPPVLAVRTQADNINALRLVLREGKGLLDADAASVDGWPVSDVSRRVARAFELGRVVGRAVEDVDRVRGSVAAYLRLARSVFSAGLVEDYREAGLVVPECVAGFCGFVPTAPAVARRAPPSDEEMAPLLAGLVALRESDGPAYVVVMAALTTGLRRSELSRWRWDWLEVRGGRRVIVFPRGAAKNHANDVVMVPDQLGEVLDWWRGCCPGDWVVPGDDRSDRRLRGQAVFRRVDAWMRGLGWARRFTLHGLRAWFGAYLRGRYGAEVAQAGLRHSDARVTERYTGRGVLPAGADVQVPH